MSDAEDAAAPGPDAGRVTPRVLKGFRDVLPAEALLRNRVVAAIRTVYERYGFAPLETPAVEPWDVLAGEGGKDLFGVATPEEDRAALRFDLTVPLARVVAQYPDLPRPFRRYQVAPVWRTDKPGPGRFREFLQFDIDTVGSSSTAADVEIVAALTEAFAAIGLDGVLVRVSSRRLLNTLVRFAGIAERRASEVFRVLDKLDKQGMEAVRLELTRGRVDASGDKIPGLGLEPEPVERIERFLRLAGKGRAETLAACSVLFDGVEGADAALGELRLVHTQLEALGLNESRVAFDPTLARGLDYYTGTIFEAVLAKAPEFGSVFGGGRYDGLVERFLGTKIPAVGGSIGVDRIAALLLKLGLARPRASATDVLVTVLDPALLAEYMTIARELRAAGIATEVYLGDARGLKKQLAYADKVQARVALLVGGDELMQGLVSVKDLDEGARAAAPAEGRAEYLSARHGQRAVARADLVATVRSLLARP